MRASSPDSDYNDYLSTLKKKTIGNVSEFHIDGLSDLSLSELSDHKTSKSKVQSKFLKKAANNGGKDVQKEVLQTPVKSKHGKKPDKLKDLNKTEKRKGSNQKSKSNLSDSDPNVSLSFIHDQRPNKVSSLMSKHVLDVVPKKQTPMSDEDTSSFGKDGGKFIKSKVARHKEMFIERDYDDLSTARDLSSPRKSTLRSARTPPSNKKVTIADHTSPVAFKTNTSSDKDVISSSDSMSEMDIKFCGQKIMSLDDFTNEATTKTLHGTMNESSDSEANNFSDVGEKIMSIADLVSEDMSMPVQTSLAREVASDRDSLSEIRTLPHTTPRKSLSSTKDQSFSEIVTVPGTRRSIGDQSASKQYSTEFEESLSKDKPSSTTRSKKSTTSYSSDLTKEDSSILSESTQISIKKKPSKERSSKHLKSHRDKKVVDEPYIFPGLESMEPIPITHYIVSPEALQSMNANSPCMILLTNMLRQQLQMTTSFIENQRRLYDSIMSTIKPTYTYCTLDDTREFIRMNRSKSLSAKEAMRLCDKD